MFVANNLTNNVMPTSTDGWKKRMHTSRADERTRHNLERSSIMHDNTTEDANEKTDGCKGNHGSSKCHQQWTVREKLEFVEEVMQAIDDGLASLATAYLQDINKISAN
jgi:hypothetical protein